MEVASETKANDNMENSTQTTKPTAQVSPWLPVTFTAGVWCVLSLVYILSGYPWLVPFVYVVQIFVLFIWRFIVFFKKKWHHFLLDICYWSNTALVIYIVCFPQNERLFCIVFALCNGVVVGGGLVFKPSMVFHDVQVFISWYMHIIPAVVTYCLRWHRPPSFCRFQVCFSEGLGGCGVLSNARTIFWHMLAPCLVYNCQTLLYMFWVWVVPHPKLRSHPGYTNMFLWMEAHWKKLNGRDPFYLMISCGGRIKKKWLLLTYTIGNTLMMWVLCILSNVVFFYRHVHEAYILSVLVLMTYFGGSYYRHLIRNANKPPERRFDPHTHRTILLLKENAPKHNTPLKRHTWAPAVKHLGETVKRSFKRNLKITIENVNTTKVVPIEENLNLSVKQCVSEY